MNNFHLFDYCRFPRLARACQGRMYMYDFTKEIWWVRAARWDPIKAGNQNMRSGRDTWLPPMDNIYA